MNGINGSTCQLVQFESTVPADVLGRIIEAMVLTAPDCQARVIEAGKRQYRSRALLTNPSVELLKVIAEQDSDFGSYRICALKQSFATHGMPPDVS